MSFRFIILTATSIIEVISSVAFDSAVVSSVINALKAESRTHVVSFSSVIVNDVENDFNAVAVENTNHSLEF